MQKNKFIYLFITENIGRLNVKFPEVLFWRDCFEVVNDQLSTGLYVGVVSDVHQQSNLNLDEITFEINGVTTVTTI